LFEHIEKLGQYNLFLSLLQKENDGVFIWTLRIMGKLEGRGKEGKGGGEGGGRRKKGRRREGGEKEGEEEGKKGKEGGKRQVKGWNDREDFYFLTLVLGTLLIAEESVHPGKSKFRIKKYLEQVPFTAAIYNVLLEIAFDKISGRVRASGSFFGFFFLGFFIFEFF
jgi:hypothetical protein